MTKDKPKRANDPINWDRQVMTDIIHIKHILATGILDKYHQGDYHAQTLALCAFTQLMVSLKDLLIKAANENKRLDDKVSADLDVTQLVANIRDAACHVTSPNNSIGNSTFIFHSETLPNGDITYSYGKFGIAFKGAVVPIFNEVKKRLIPLTDFPPSHFE